MIFEQGRHTTHNFTLNDQPLEIVKNFKYLGIYFFKNGQWYRTQKHLAQHSLFALHNLFTVFYQLDLKIHDKITKKPVFNNNNNIVANKKDTHRRRRARIEERR